MIFAELCFWLFQQKPICMLADSQAFEPVLCPDLQARLLAGVFLKGMWGLPSPSPHWGVCSGPYRTTQYAYFGWRTPVARAPVILQTLIPLQLLSTLYSFTTNHKQLFPLRLFWRRWRGCGEPSFPHGQEHRHFPTMLPHFPNLGGPH